MAAVLDQLAVHRRALIVGRPDRRGQDLSLALAGVGFVPLVASDETAAVEFLRMLQIDVLLVCATTGRLVEDATRLGIPIVDPATGEPVAGHASPHACQVATVAARVLLLVAATASAQGNEVMAWGPIRVDFARRQAWVAIRRSH